ncbi:hypothetical protein AtubIFM55763_007880 [Aspergillus tubingensis]|uniref:Uncharacterized protein n=2 Tax=Aspergillus subgen. Circumdati TaxID=2720871 RepID=A0A124BYG7_ASPNG|nr:hypothetical protein AKAW_10024 [Aspergillus niger]GLA76310.1 hypothetical protein AtubIFM55763_007880 [Aspergillus tubingensis]GLA87081.1 hypothetical protein AtubIFM56815_011354 [Aspergillus tubingensis]
MEQFIDIVSQYFPMLDVLRNMERPRRLATNGDMSPPRLSPVEHLLRNNPELYRGLEKAALATGHVEEGLRRQLHHAQQFKESMRLELARKKSDIRSLTQQIQALNFQPNILSDDDIAQHMRRLLQRLRNWTNTYFRDLDQLNKLRQDLERSGAMFVPRGPHEIRAFIASVVSQILFQRIFSSYLLGIPNEESPRFVSIAETLRQNCPGNVEHHWRTATSIAAEKLGDEQSDINMVVSQVEIMLSQYYSVEPPTVARRLRALVQECMQFKRDLDRQLSRYHFFRSALGDNFAPDHMQQAIPFQEVAGRVKCTLWPGLYKESTSGALVVVPETVLATKDAEDQRPTYTEASKTLVPGLQDVSDHLSDSGESVDNEGVSCRDLAFDIELGGDTV